jgi:hypothetical protein
LGYSLRMTVSEISQGSGEPVEPDAEETEREGIARVIYVAPVALAIERGPRGVELESLVETKDEG